ncbi:MAG TPA: hypothetical protein VGH07_02785 [Chthoniobacterales bacterium]
MWAVRAWVLWLVIGLLGFANMQQALAQQITPPFGFHWGETEKEIAKILTRTGATIIDRSVVQGREAWTIDGLIQPALKQTIVYFGTAKVLVEVELQYQRPEWDLVAYEQFLDSARQTLESRYGPATVLVKDKKPEGDVMQTVVGYQWQAQGSSIQLFFYSAERNSDVYRSVSLHYRAG